MRRLRVCRGFSSLKLIAVAATGVDNVDLEFCRSKGIAVCNTRGYAVNSLPEHALMLMLALRRNLVAYIVTTWDQVSGTKQVNFAYWIIRLVICMERIGVIGYGTLGHSMAELLGAVGMEVLVAERKVAPSRREGGLSLKRCYRGAT